MLSLAFFHVREYISLRSSGELVANSNASRRFFDEKEAAVLAYDGDANEIAIIPLDEAYDMQSVHAISWKQGNASIGSTAFAKDNNIRPDQTIRYSPEWDDSLGGPSIDGGLLIDLDQEGQVVEPGTADDPDE